MQPDPQLPPVFRRADALQAGLTRNQIETRLRTGRWIPVRRGVFCLKERYDGQSAATQIEIWTLARQASSRRRLAISHISAAAMWGLPLPLAKQHRATLTDGDVSQCTRHDIESVIQVAQLWPGDTWERNGLLITSPARTVADCLRHYPAETAVPMADAALREHLTDRTAIAAVLRRQAGWPYFARAGKSWPLIDGRRESWLESTSAVRLWRVGIELAQPQVEVFDSDRRFVARVDFLWPDQATVGEADGRGKYGAWPGSVAGAPSDEMDGPTQVAASRRAVLAEKDREDALRDLGLEVVRWGTAELLNHPESVARRIMRARRRGSRQRFVGAWRFKPEI
jgi:hypothetical protein